jgi:LysM repeat protein
VFWYSVQPGDSLYLIAQKLGTTVKRIIELNGNSLSIYINQNLLIDNDVAKEKIDVVYDRDSKKDIDIYKVPGKDAIFYKQNGNRC